MTELDLPGLLLIEPKVFEDDRGFFMETFHADRYFEFGMPRDFVQDNHSKSIKGTLRGLHYQIGKPQGKLVRVTQGEIFDIAVDIRRGSPHFGQWVGVMLTEANKHQLYVPEGFAHGFCVVSETAEFLYKCTDFYAPEEERGIRWDDPELAIDWPVTDPVLSEKDNNYPLLSEAGDDLPPFER